MHIGVCDCLHASVGEVAGGREVSDWNSCEIAVGWANVKWALVTRKMNWDSGDWASLLV